VHRSSERRDLKQSAGRARRRIDVTLVGDANFDIILYGLPEELTPKRKLLASEMQIHLGGSAAITAHSLAALGNTTGLITTTAGDYFAVGAGDSFNAGFLHGWLRDWPIEQALVYGNLVGGWSTGSPGGTSAFRGAEKIQALERAWNEMQSVPTDRCSMGVLKQF